MNTKGLLIVRDEELVQLLRRLYPDRDTTGFNVFDFLHAEGSPAHALLYSRLFWPEFVEIDEMVLLKESVEDEADRDRLAGATKRYSGDRRKTEESFNLVEVPCLFGKRLLETDEKEAQWLADRLAAMWRCRLKELYPSRRFSVEVIPPEETGGEVGIVFYQIDS